MYVPAHFAAEDADALIARLVGRHAALLITNGPDGAPFASHIPLLWDAERKIASGHIARANPHHTFGADRALIVLSGAEAYVSPGWYPSKGEHGKTVPTWNYESVHLSGALEWFDDAARLEAVVRALSDRHEAGRAQPWSIEDAPRSYITSMLRGIVGVSVAVDRIEAKRKLSQNKSDADFRGVAAGLAASANADDQEIATHMRALRAIADDPDGN